MKGQGFEKLRIAALSTGTVLASLFGAVSRSARASTQLPVVYTSSTRWQVQSSDCAERFGLPGHVCGLGVRQFSEVANTTLPTTYVPPPTTFTLPTTNTPPPTTYTPPPTTYMPPPTYTPPPTTYMPPPTYTPPPTTYMPPPTTSPPPDDDQAAAPTQHDKRLHAKSLTDIFAFNNSLGLAIGNELFQAPSGRVDFSAGSVSAGPEQFGAVSARVQYQFFAADKTTRAVFTFDNTSTSAVDVDMRTNIGGFDGGSTIASSSLSENQVTGVNRWYQTVAAHAANGATTAPSVLFVASGSDGRWTLPAISKVSFGSGVDEYVNRYHFHLDAGHTAAIMIFAQANPNPVSAAAVDAAFSNLSALDAAGLLINLPVARIKILNWNKSLRPLPLPNRPLSKS